MHPELIVCPSLPGEKGFTSSGPMGGRPPAARPLLDAHGILINGDRDRVNVLAR